MKRFILTACAGLLAAAVASPSLAADLPRPAYKSPGYSPLYVAPFSWTGFYVGINGGYGWGDADLSSSSSTFNTGKQDGGLAGGTIGYNLQTGNWVWGLEGDIDYAWIKGNTSNTAGTGCAGGGACELKNTYLATARGRIGYSWDRWLPFVTGGAAFGNMKIEAPNGNENTKTNTGWTIGGGLEYAFVGAWSAKLEYLYVDLGTATCDATVCGVSVDYKAKINVVRAGLNYRF